MEKEIIRIGKMSEANEARKIPISVATKGGGLIFVSGLPPVNWQTGELVRGDVRDQFRQCLENVKAALEAAGSSMDRVLKTTILTTNSAYYDELNAIYAEYFPANPPARNVVVVGSWPFEFDVELDAIALA